MTSCRARRKLRRTWFSIATAPTAQRFNPFRSETKSALQLCKSTAKPIHAPCVSSANPTDTTETSIFPSFATPGRCQLVEAKVKGRNGTLSTRTAWGWASSYTIRRLALGGQSLIPIAKVRTGMPSHTVPTKRRHSLATNA